MKKKVLLVLLPALALALGSCTGNSSDADDDDEETSQVTPGGDIDPAEFGTKDSPLTIAQAKALLDKLDPEKTGETYLGQRVYVAGKVSANAAKENNKFSYAYIEDKTAGDFSLNYFVLDGSITGNYDAKNSMKDKMVVASGFACIFKDSKGVYKYELTSPKDSEEQAKIESIRDPGVLPDFNPGTEAAPLTVSQAIDQIDNHTEARTSGVADMYVAGKVKSNNAWSKGEGYSNIDFVITDGEKDFTVFRATELPGYSTAEAEAIVAGALVGMNAVVKAPAYYYSQGKIYETAANPDVLSLAFPAATSVEFTQSTYDAYINAEVDLDNLVRLLPAGSVGSYEFNVPEGIGSFNPTTNVYTMPSSAQEFDVQVRLVGAADWNEGKLHFNVTVPEGDAITSITVSPSSLTFTEGGAAQNLTAVTDPVSSSSNHVEWVFADGEADDVVSLDFASNERVCAVTPLKAGTTKVVARVSENHDVKIETPISITVEAALTPLSGITAAGMSVVADGVVVVKTGKNMLVDDGTGAIVCYNSSASWTFNEGDRVHIEGTSAQRNGGVQLSNPTVTAKANEVVPTTASPLTEATAAEYLADYTADESSVVFGPQGRVSFRTGTISYSSDIAMWEFGTVQMESALYKTASMASGKVYDVEGYITSFYKSGETRYLCVAIMSAVEYIAPGKISSITADTVNLTVGGSSAQITCVTVGDPEATYTYDTSAEGIVNVSATGEVSPVTAGEVTVTVTNNYSETATILFYVYPAGGPTELSLTNLGTNFTDTSTSNHEGTFVVHGYSFSYFGKKQGNAVFVPKQADGGYFYNTSELPKDIDSIIVYTNSGAAAGGSYTVAFSDTAPTGKFTTGASSQSMDGGATSSAYSCSVNNARYFCIYMGNAKNGQVLSVKINFK